MACFPANLVTFVRAFAKHFFFLFFFFRRRLTKEFFSVLREQLETTKSICLRFLADISLLFVLYEPLKMLNCKNVQKGTFAFAFNPTLLLHGSLVNSMKMPKSLPYFFNTFPKIATISGLFCVTTLCYHAIWFCWIIWTCHSHHCRPIGHWYLIIVVVVFVPAVDCWDLSGRI